MHQYEYLKLRQEEMLEEAESYRLISLAHRSSLGRRSSLSAALAWWGSKLSRWGDILQERFGDSMIIEKTRVIN